jgi:hypothetical protein
MAPPSTSATASRRKPVPLRAARDAEVIAALRAALTTKGDDGRLLLKERSVQNIKSCLAAIVEHCGPDGFARAIVSKSKLLHSCICKRWPHPPTLARMVSAVVSSLKYDPDLGTAAMREFWRQRLGEAIASSTLLAKNNVLTERELATMPGFEEMREAAEKAGERDPRFAAGLPRVSVAPQCNHDYAETRRLGPASDRRAERTRAEGL